MKNKINIEEKLRCPNPKCKSTEVRYRMRTKDYWCRRCGYEFKLGKDNAKV
jgi:hypothetical protein